MSATPSSQISGFMFPSNTLEEASNVGKTIESVHSNIETDGSSTQQAITCPHEDAVLLLRIDGRPVGLPSEATTPSLPPGDLLRWVHQRGWWMGWQPLWCRVVRRQWRPDRHLPLGMAGTSENTAHDTGVRLGRVLLLGLHDAAREHTPAERRGIQVLLWVLVRMLRLELRRRRRSSLWLRRWPGRVVVWVWLAARVPQARFQQRGPNPLFGSQLGVGDGRREQIQGGVGGVGGRGASVWGAVGAACHELSRTVDHLWSKHTRRAAGRAENGIPHARTHEMMSPEPTTKHDPQNQDV